VAEAAFLHFPAQMQADRVRLARLPGSARRVFDAVVRHGPVTPAQLHELTGLPPRTARYGVKRLREAGFVETRCSLRDCRTCYFFVHRRCAGLEAIAAGARPGSGLPVLPVV
jgi:DNA-binding transcriptional ArsR family regulator